jgi:primosomal replication protein N
LETTNDNIVILEGHFIQPPEFSHELFGEEFYTGLFSVNRLSESKDILNVTISKKLLPEDEQLYGKYTKITGQLRSYNKIVGSKNKLLLTVFARELDFPDEKADEPNVIELTGYICKDPIYRMTPFGREITDLLMAVNRQFNKTDYIPVIAWGRNAKYTKNMQVGNMLKIVGRLQSRGYTKTYPDGHIEEKVAYEVSSSSIQKLSFMNNSDENDTDTTENDKNLNIS